MRAYLNCLSDTMADLLDAAEKSPETIELGPLPEAAKAEARQLYYFFGLCSAKAARCRLSRVLKRAMASRLGVVWFNAMNLRLVEDTCR